MGAIAWRSPRSVLGGWTHSSRTASAVRHPLRFLGRLPPLEVVASGDDLGKAGQRYGMRLQDLLQLNPGLQGSSPGNRHFRFRVANSSPPAAALDAGTQFLS